MNSLEAMKPLAKAGREPFVSGNLIDEQRVTPSFWRIEGIQEGRSRRLVLVRHIGMPGNGARPSFQESLEGKIVCPTVNNMNLGVSVGFSSCRMDMKPPKALYVSAVMTWPQRKQGCWTYYCTNSLAFSIDKSAKSWSRKTSTLRRAASKAS